MPRADHPQVEIASRADLRAWLAANHAQSSSIWLVSWKKGDPRRVRYGDIADELLCFGWIDSLPRKLDTGRTMLRLSPRKPDSGWSTVNKARIERLLTGGLMQPAGLDAIATAQANGAWQRLDAAGALVEPDDLVAAFSTQPAAAVNWQAFPPSTRRSMLEWIAQARTAATRARRVAEIAESAAVNQRAFPRRSRPANQSGLAGAALSLPCSMA